MAKLNCSSTGLIVKTRFKADNEAPRVYVAMPSGPFRVHPDAEMHWKNVWLARYKGVWHLLDPVIIEQGLFLDGMTKMRGDLYVCINDKGRLFLLPATYNENPDFKSWRRTLIPIVKQARKQWMELVSNHDDNVYVGGLAKVKIPEPVWDEKILDTIFNDAFRGRVIDERYIMDVNCENKETVGRLDFDLEE